MCRAYSLSCITNQAWQYLHIVSDEEISSKGILSGRAMASL